MDEDYLNIDVSTFQKPLGMLAETIAQKIQREGSQCISAPAYTYADLFIMLRQSRYTYDFLFYLHADERRNSDPYWRNEYTMVCVPVIRSMIDDLYNISTIIGDPYLYGPLFRKSGYRKIFLDLDEDERMFGDQEKWATYIREKRKAVRFELRQVSFEEADVLDKKKNPDWKTLGRDLAREKNLDYTVHQEFLATFTLGAWRDYSAMSHGSFEGLVQIGGFYNRDGHRHADRPKLDLVFPRVLAMHIGRAAIILLCTITEVQLRFHFKDANIPDRIRTMWNYLKDFEEGKFIYERWYQAKLHRL